VPTSDEQDQLLTAKLDEWESSGRTLTPDFLAPDDLLLRGLLREAMQSRRTIAAAVRYQNDTQPGIDRPLNRLEPGSEIGGYRIEQFIASSGSAHVYRATQRSTDRNVAIKLLKPTLDPTVREARLMHEARMIGKLSHPNIAGVFDAGSIPVDGNSQPFLAMEWIEGQSLRQALSELRRLPVVKRIDLFEQVCSALSYAHSKLVLHLDMKPENVLVDESLGKARVVDFGIGTQLDATESVPPRPSGSGTPRYMAPEQYRGDVTLLDVRTDVWGLGMLLYELIAGTHPMEGLTREQIAERLNQGSWTPPTVPGIARELNAIVERCLAINPDARYATVASLLSDLSGWRSHRPIAAIPTSTLRRGRLFIRRNWIAVGGSLVAAGLLTGYLIQTTLARRESDQLRTIAVRERDTAVQERERADRARTEADINARRSEAMGLLFDEATDAVSVKRGGSPTLSLKDVYLKLLEAVDSRFPDDPLIRGMVRNRVGLALQSLGDVQGSLTPLREAYELLSEFGGADVFQQRTAAAAYMYGLANVAAIAEADQLYASASAWIQNPGDDPQAIRPVVQLLGNYANVLIRAERMNEMMSVAQRGIDLCDQVGPELRDERAHLVSRLAVQLYTSRNFQGAYDLFTSAEADFRATKGQDSSDADAMLMNRAMCLGPLGRSAEALPMLHDLLVKAVTRFGPEHPETADLYLALATNLVESGKAADSISYYEKCIAIRRKTIGDQHRNTVLALNNLASAYDKLDRIEEGLRVATVLRDLLPEAQISPQFRVLLATRYPRALARSGAFAQAIPLLQASIADLEAHGMQKHDVMKAMLQAMIDCAHGVNDSALAQEYQQKLNHIQPTPATQPTTSPGR
jgi:eukaryotic-like serine/threonine-protein kinase